MTITVIRSCFNGTTASAPALNGNAGSLRSVLDFCLVTTLGWTKPYTGTNLVAYKQSAGSNQMYLRVDDSVGQNAQMRGYEAMSAISTGTGWFPSDLQNNGGVYLYKSQTSDSTQRPYYFVSDGKAFWLVILYNSNSTNYAAANNSGAYFFGDCVPLKPGGDLYCTAVIGNVGASDATASAKGHLQASGFAGMGGHYVARACTGFAGSTNVGKWCNNNFYSGVEIGSTSAVLLYPSPIEGGLVCDRLYMPEGNAAGQGMGLRGIYPGAWGPLNLHPFQQADVITGTAGTALDGRTFEAINIGQSGQLMFETSDTWRS